MSPLPHFSLIILSHSVSILQALEVSQRVFALRCLGRCSPSVPTLLDYKQTTNAQSSFTSTNNLRTNHTRGSPHSFCHFLRYCTTFVLFRYALTSHESACLGSRGTSQFIEAREVLLMARADPRYNQITFPQTLTADLETVSAVLRPRNKQPAASTLRWTLPLPCNLSFRLLSLVIPRLPSCAGLRREQTASTMPT